MVTRARIVLTSLLVLMFSGSIALAQEYGPASGRPAFAQQELDQMLAPIALYPDALLSQILMASTYPAEVVEAARWSRRNPDLDGDRAVRAVNRMDWDPSVKSLVAFPQILALMDEKLDWTGRLGDAFYAQQADVMDSVQHLRQKAYIVGNRGSTDRLRVDRQGQAIVIELANPGLLYVPHYNPTAFEGRGGSGNRPDARGERGERGSSSVAQASPRKVVASEPGMRSAPSHPNAPGAASRAKAEPQPAAINGVGHGTNAGKFGTRGPASHQASASAGGTAPASQLSENVAASVPSGKAAAPRPTRKPRHSDGLPHRQP